MPFLEDIFQAPGDGAQKTSVTIKKVFETEALFEVSYQLVYCI